MAEKKWLKTVPGSLRLGASVLEMLAHGDKEQRGPYEIGQGGKGRFEERAKCKLKMFPQTETLWESQKLYISSFF